MITDLYLDELTFLLVHDDKNLISMRKLNLVAFDLINTSSKNGHAFLFNVYIFLTLS